MLRKFLLFVSVALVAGKEPDFSKYMGVNIEQDLGIVSPPLYPPVPTHTNTHTLL